VRFSIEQRFAGDPGAIAAAYADPELYRRFGPLPRAGHPEVVHHEVDDGEVHLDVRWQFTAPLSSAARAVIDPHRLTWVERSAHDLAERTVRFRMVPDHYRDRLRCEGTYRFEADGPGRTIRRTEGELRVKAPLVARAVEHAIVDGLREQLDAEVVVVEAYVKA
jgi:hypothetical protein